jgi:hypothetical protein
MPKGVSTVADTVLRRWGLTPWTRRPVQPLRDRWPTGIVCSNGDYHRLRRLEYRTALHCRPGASASKLDTAEHAMLLENEALPNVMCIVLNADTYHILAYKIEGRSFDVSNKLSRRHGTTSVSWTYRF